MQTPDSASFGLAFLNNIYNVIKNLNKLIRAKWYTTMQKN